MELGDADFLIQPSQGECKFYSATMGARVYLSNEVDKLMQIVRVPKSRKKFPLWDSYRCE